MKRRHVNWQSLTTRFAVAGAGLVVVCTAAVVTAPHLRPASQTEQPVQLVQPASDEPAVATTAMEATAAAVQASDGADRAEKAAGRAEVAAERAETAAVHVDQVVATTSTTGTPAGTGPTGPATTSTTGPTLLAEVPHPTTTITITTTVPKSWVVIARFPISQSTSADLPLTVDVTLQTGQLRVSGFPSALPFSSSNSMVWLGDNESDRLVPTGACPPTDDNRGTVVEDSVRRTPDCVWRGGWAPGPHTIVAGTYAGDGWRAPAGRATTLSAEIIVEEYR